MIRLVIDGDPIPAARPRYSVRRVYQPKRNVEYRKQVQAASLVAMNGKAPMTGAISAVVKLYRKYKPSARNYGMNRIVFLDDRQITRCVVEKFTDAKNPRAEVEIEER